MMPDDSYVGDQNQSTQFKQDDSDNKLAIKNKLLMRLKNHKQESSSSSEVDANDFSQIVSDASGIDHTYNPYSFKRLNNAIFKKPKVFM